MEICFGARSRKNDNQLLRYNLLQTGLKLGAEAEKPYE